MGGKSLDILRHRLFPRLLFIWLCLVTLTGTNKCQEDYILLKTSPSPSPTATPDDDDDIDDDIDDDDDDDDLLTPTPTPTPTETPTPTPTATPTPTPTPAAFRALIRTGEDLRSSLANAQNNKEFDEGEGSGDGSSNSRAPSSGVIRKGSGGKGGSPGNWLGNLYTDKEGEGEELDEEQDSLPDDLATYCEYLSLKRSGQPIPKSRPDLLEMEVDSAVIGFEPSDCE